MNASLYSKALKALVRRPHSVAELHAKLMQACQRTARQRARNRREDQKAIELVDQPESTSQPGQVSECKCQVDLIMKQLNEQNVLDDASFAKWHVEQRSAWRPRSRLELRAELGRKGVPRQDSAAAMQSHSDLAAAAKLAAGRPSALGPSLMQYLVRKGFSMDIARRVMVTRERGGTVALNGLAEEAVKEATVEAEAAAGLPVMCHTIRSVP